MLAGCAKDCGPFSISSGGECVPWNQLFAGTWTAGQGGFCNGGQAISGSIDIRPGNLANQIEFQTELMASPAILTISSDTKAAGMIGTTKVELTRFPRGGQGVNLDPTDTERILVQTWLNYDTENQVFCSAPFF